MCIAKLSCLPSRLQLAGRSLPLRSWKGLSAMAVSDEIKTTVEHYNGSESEAGMVRVGFPDLRVIQRVRSALRASNNPIGKSQHVQ